jgi:hypothetical protein
MRKPFEVPKAGSLAHALTILSAGGMLYDNDDRFPPRVFAQLLARRERNPFGYGRIVSGVTYPDPRTALTWFYVETADASDRVYGQEAREAAKLLDLIAYAAQPMAVAA